MIKIMFDGACWPNPGGKCSGGAVVLKNNVILSELAGEYVPEVKYATSNNVGEYYGLYVALKYLVENDLCDEKVEVVGDSDMVIKQMSGRWRIKKGFYLDLAKKVVLLREKFNDIKFKWMPREENEWADALSKSIYKNPIPF